MAINTNAKNSKEPNCTECRFYDTETYKALKVPVCYECDEIPPEYKGKAWAIKPNKPACKNFRGQYANCR